jgi:hypothetical protein
MNPDGPMVGEKRDATHDLQIRPRRGIFGAQLSGGRRSALYLLRVDTLGRHFAAERDARCTEKQGGAAERSAGYSDAVTGHIFK